MYKEATTARFVQVPCFQGGSIQLFQSQYLPSLSINYVAIKKGFGKIATTVVLDEDEKLL